MVERQLPAVRDPGAEAEFRTFPPPELSWDLDDYGALELGKKPELFHLKAWSGRLKSRELRAWENVFLSGTEEFRSNLLIA